MVFVQKRLQPLLTSTFEVKAFSGFVQCLPKCHAIPAYALSQKGKEKKKKRQIYPILLFLKYNINKEILPKEATTNFSSALQCTFVLKFLSCGFGGSLHSPWRRHVPIREGLSTKLKYWSVAVSSIGESHFRRSNLTPNSGGITPFIHSSYNQASSPHHSHRAAHGHRRVHCKAGRCTCPRNRGVSVKSHAGTKNPKPSSHANSNLISSTRV